MAKSKVDMSKLALGNAKPIVKPGAENKQPDTSLDEVVKEIHQAETTPDPPVVPPPTPNPTPVPDKRMGRPATRNRADTIRLSVDIPKPLFKRAKKKLIDLDMTMIEYVTRLIEQDLEG